MGAAGVRRGVCSVNDGWRFEERERERWNEDGEDEAGTRVLGWGFGSVWQRRRGTKKKGKGV